MNEESIDILKEELPDFNVPYTVFEIIIAVTAVCDLLIGLLGIPFAILSDAGLPRQLHACLVTLSLLLTFCTISILHLVAVSADRYWTIVYPMSNYSLNLRKGAPSIIISLCWTVGGLFGLLPLMGWYTSSDEDFQCRFHDVMTMDYLAFIFLATILLPALLMFAFYSHIYVVVTRQLWHNRDVPPSLGNDQIQKESQQFEVMIAKKLIALVTFFMVCWFPIHFMNFIEWLHPTISIPSELVHVLIILSHLNSPLNPLLYAFLSPAFRTAIKNVVCVTCQRECDDDTRIEGGTVTDSRLDSVSKF